MSVILLHHQELKEIRIKKKQFIPDVGPYSIIQRSKQVLMVKYSPVLSKSSLKQVTSRTQHKILWLQFRILEAPVVLTTPRGLETARYYYSGTVNKFSKLLTMCSRVLLGGELVPGVGTVIPVPVRDEYSHRTRHDISILDTDSVKAVLLYCPLCWGWPPRRSSTPRADFVAPRAARPEPTYL